MQVDFAEHHTLPFGPVVAGSNWYACQVLGCTFLGVISWTTQRRLVRHYLSEIRDTSSVMATECVKDAVAAAGLRDLHHRRVVILVDAGPHFVSTRFMAWVLVHLLQSRSHISEVVMMVAPPGRERSMRRRVRRCQRHPRPSGKEALDYQHSEVRGASPESRR